MSIPATSTAPLPLWVRAIVLPIVFVVLFFFFVFLGFPYDELAESLSRQVERGSGVQLRFEEVSPHLGLMGPGLQAEGVTALSPGGLEIDLDQIVARPAWSLSWFTLDPAIHVDATRGEAAIVGTVTLSAEPGWDGEFRSVDLRLLPLDQLLPGGNLDGTLSAKADLRALEDGLSGSLAFAVADGSIGLPGLPIGMPFETLEGDVVFGGESWAAISRLDLTGPMLTAKAHGSIGRAARRGDEALDLNVDLKVVDPNIKGAVRGLGVRVAGDGLAKIRITGPMSNPQVVRGG